MSEDLKPVLNSMVAGGEGGCCECLPPNMTLTFLSVPKCSMCGKELDAVIAGCYCSLECVQKYYDENETQIEFPDGTIYTVPPGTITIKIEPSKPQNPSS